MQEEKDTEGFVNIESLPVEDFLAFRSMVADEIEADTLDYVNKNSLPVKPRRSFYTRFVKRALDVVFSVIALFITLPINLIIAICTYFDVGRPIFFKQNRIGLGGKEFVLIKFRNMTNATDENGNLLPAAQRVTKFGKFVRKTSLDELLNFWSILKGDMSLIGPRPLVPLSYRRYSDRHKMRTAVRPGLECPFLHSPDHKVTWTEQFENDIFYVENVSFALDVKLMFALVKMTLNRKGNSMRGAAVRGSFTGYNRDGSSINSQAVPVKYVDAALRRIEEQQRDSLEVAAR